MWKLTPEEIMAAVNEALRDPSKGIENTVAQAAGEKALKAVHDYLLEKCTVGDHVVRRGACPHCLTKLLEALRLGTLPSEVK